MSEAGKNRIAYLDALKAVSILLVVYCHSPLLSKETFAGNVMMTLAWAAVPCFMMVTGALMHSKKTFSWKKYLIRLLKVCISIFVWKIVYVIIFSIAAHNIPGKVEVFNFLFLFKDIPGIDVGFLWYMYSYLVCMIIYPLTFLVFKNQDKNSKGMKIFLLTVTGVFGFVTYDIAWIISLMKNAVSFNLPDVGYLFKINPFTNHPHMIFFFLLGAVLYENRELIEKWFKGRKWIAALILVIGMAMLIIIKRIDSGFWTWGGVYLKDGYTRVPVIILAVGLYFCFNVFKFDKFYDIIGRIVGTNTMGIYYIHWPIVMMSEKFLYNHLPGYFFGMNAVKTIVVAAIAIGITFIIKKIPVVKNIVS